MKFTLQVQLQVGLELCRVESVKIFNLRMKFTLQVQLQVGLELCRVESFEVLQLTPVLPRHHAHNVPNAA
jgi:hypothetical protein